MIFDDEEMKFWKSISDGDENVPNLEIHPTTLRAIFQRLEAAEKVVEAYTKIWDGSPELEAWRKARGK